MGEFEGGDETGLLVQVAEVADKFDDLGLFSEFFTSFGLNCNRHVTRVYPSDTPRKHVCLCHIDCIPHYAMFQKWHIIY